MVVSVITATRELNANCSLLLLFFLNAAVGVVQIQVPIYHFNGFKSIERIRHNPA